MGIRDNYKSGYRGKSGRTSHIKRDRKGRFCQDRRANQRQFLDDYVSVDIRNFKPPENFTQGIVPFREGLAEVIMVPWHFGGRRAYFLCPDCGRKVLKLYQQCGRNLFCRKCVGLPYRIQYMDSEEQHEHMRAKTEKKISRKRIRKKTVAKILNKWKARQEKDMVKFLSPMYRLLSRLKQL